MKSKGVFSLTVVLLLVLLSIGKCQSQPEEWVPCTASSKMVDLKFWMLDGTSYINISITFSCAGFKVSDWGTVMRKGYEIWADSKIWMWTGPSAQVITTMFHTYNLGCLESGNYTFTFMAWSVRVKSINFTIVRPDANQDPTPVGGIYIPINKLQLLAPYIGLTILLVVAVITLGYIKKRKRDTEISLNQRTI
jgi:hypothetical protein